MSSDTATNSSGKPRFTARVVRALAAGTTLGVVLAGLSTSTGFLTPVTAFAVGPASALAIELSKDFEQST